MICAIISRFVPREKMNQKCDPIVREECGMTMKTDCQNLCKEKCENQDKKVCMTIPHQECKEKPVENCQDIPQTQCRKVSTLDPRNLVPIINFRLFSYYRYPKKDAQLLKENLANRIVGQRRKLNVERNLKNSVGT